MAKSLNRKNKKSKKTRKYMSKKVRKSVRRKRGGSREKIRIYTDSPELLRNASDEDKYNKAIALGVINNLKDDGFGNDDGVLFESPTPILQFYGDTIIDNIPEYPNTWGHVFHRLEVAESEEEKQAINDLVEKKRNFLMNNPEILEAGLRYRPESLEFISEEVQKAYPHLLRIAISSAVNDMHLQQVEEFMDDSTDELKRAIEEGERLYYQAQNQVLFLDDQSDLLTSEGGSNKVKQTGGSGEDLEQLIREFQRYGASEMSAFGAWHHLSRTYPEDAVRIGRDALAYIRSGNCPGNQPWKKAHYALHGRMRAYNAQRTRLDDLGNGNNNAFVP